MSGLLNPFRTAVPFWGQNPQISSSLSPKRDSGFKGVTSFSAALYMYINLTLFPSVFIPKRKCGAKRAEGKGIRMGMRFFYW